MSDFSLAITTTLRREGGYSEVAGDPGGNTDFGVSLRWLKGQGLLLQELEAEDHTQDVVQVVKQMTREQAEDIYRKYWWDKYNYGAILGQMIAGKVFDTAVNVGASRSHKFLQSSLGLTADGILGPATLKAVNTTNNITAYAAFQKQQAAFYQDLVAVNPSLEKFLTGWLNRAFDRN